MSELSTNFNISPYNDDYSEEKDYVRILFRPRVPVQARELTQLQTYMQKQVSRFGDHVFKDGSVVDGCHVTYEDRLDYVSMENAFYSNSTLRVTDVDDTHVLVGNTTGARAVVVAAKEGFSASFPASNRFYVKYVVTGNGGSTFARGEYVKVYGPDQDKLDTLNEANYVDQIKVLDVVGATGQGYGVTVSDGKIFHKGFFSRVARQTVVVKDYDVDPSGYRVGFDTTEEIVTEDNDETLNDNALGYPNYNAPGAHRLKLTPVLVAKTKSEAETAKNFFAIVEFDGSAPTEQNTDAAYNVLGNEMAKRTFEESGDYVVKPFTVETFPGTNANTALEDANLFSYSVSTGIAYVKGYRVEKIGTSNVVVQRAFTEATSEAQVVTANYGNYVVVSELMGQFDHKRAVEVAIYDAAQSTITDLEKASGARSGSIVGYATLKSLQFYSGTKGTPSCQYLAYLDNVRMNSGKSFSTHARSIYATSGYGDARCDVVLSTNRYANGSLYSLATLNDASMRTLVFPIGPSSVKSLTDNSGASDTQFIFTDYANATLQTNGYVSVSINSPGAGGSERLNASGTLTSLGEKENFDVVLGADVLTANLTGTVSISSTTANVVGTGTSFTTLFKAGEYIKVFHQSSHDYRRVTTVTNATHMVIASNSSVTNTSCAFAKLYPEGTHVDLSSASANVVVSSNTAFAVNTYLDLGGNLTASSNVVVSYPVLKYNAYPMTKAVKKSVYVKINLSSHPNSTNGPWCLGLPDVFKVRGAYLGSGYSNANFNAASWMTLDTGQRDSHYGLSYLYVKPEYKSSVAAYTRMLVELDHFQANSSSGVGYFCVDSYPTSNSDSGSNTVHWGEIPTFTATDGEFYDLRNCVDYRPYAANTANSALTEVGATVNPANASMNAYSSSTVGYTPAPDTNFQADVAYYLPRRDVLVVNRAGDFTVVTGEPAENPVTPRVDDDVMVVANAYVPAWPTLTSREAEEFGRHDAKVKHTIMTNRRYTMRDIGALEQRIKRMEYYTVLNAVEQKARDFTVTDVNGLDRFKNGIFADPFNGHTLGKVDDFEYKVAVDPEASVARPFFERHHVDFAYDDAQSSTTRTGNYVTAPYAHEDFITQRFASKYRNCTESVWAWNGKLNLYPAFDDHRDEVAMPNFNVQLDLAQPWEDFASSMFGTMYGDWRTSNTSVKTTGQTSATTTTQERIVSELHVDTSTNSYDLGSFVKDVTVEPYMRSRLVSFVATNMKPNTVLHAFFDNVLVDEHCAPGEEDNVTDPQAGREDRILKRSGAFGDALRSDSSGVVRGIFRIPAETFRVGDRMFVLTDVDDVANSGSSAVTRADARFSASNVTLSTQSITIGTVEPELTVVQTTENRTVVSNLTIPQRPVGNDGGNDGNRDPIAQSIAVTTPNGESGVFITKFDVYFKAKDAKLGVTLLLVETRFGDPDTTRVIGRSHLDASEVTVSDDASSATTFTLNNPVFVAAGEYYAFLVKPDGDSPEYKIWLGETGGYDVTTGEQIYQNPYSGVAYVSSNMNAWTALQKEDIKFTAYRADFTVGSATAVFENEADEFLTLTGIVKANSASYVQVGDFAYTANSANTSQVFTGANTTQPFGVVQFVDEPSGTVYLDTSTSGWAAGQVVQFHRPTAAGNAALVNASSLVATANLSSVDDLQYHAVVPRFSIMSPARTGAVLRYRGYDSTDAVDAGTFSVLNDVEYEFLDKTRIAKSFSTEATDVGGDKSCRFEITLSTESRLLSPVVDLRRKASLFIENLVNNDDTGEANTRYGSALTKYVSRNVVLADGQEAEDLRVVVSAYKPSGTDFRVYAKFQNGEDSEPFDEHAWTELTAEAGAEVFSSPIDRRDFTDFEFSVPSSAPASNSRAAYLGASDGILTYVNAAGSQFYGYKTFCIKVVLLSSNAARVPMLNDLRAMALQV